MASRHVNHSYRRDDAFARKLGPQRYRGTCKVCGAILDVFHDDSFCAEAWIRQFETPDATEGRTHEK